MASTLPVDASALPATEQLHKKDPSLPSSDYSHSIKFWKIASDILDGVEAMRAVAIGNIGGPARQFQNVPTQSFAAMRGTEAESPYLPKFPEEPWEEYNRRRNNSFLTNIYGDISNNLSSKPFSKTCELSQDTPDDIKKLSMNIDGLGNNLHVFARDVFKTAMDKAISWIMCEYTKVPAGATLEAERNMGARPYWVHIPAERLIAVYSKFLNGVEIIFHARIDEPAVELDGYEEKAIKRIRELNREPILDGNGNITGFKPATWKLLEETVEKDKTTGRENSTWKVVDSGDITIRIIPLVPIILGKRDGTSWRVTPPLRDLVYMQVKLFQMESNLDSTKELTAFPMLTGNGINGTGDDGKTKIKVPVGPRAVLFAPPNGSSSPGSWQFIEPSGSSLTFLQADIDKHKTEMRDLGLQPLDSTNLTVITTANVSAKANNAVQAWALMLKDALEQAWKITLMWLKRNDEPTVYVYTDFGVDVDGSSDMSELQAMEAASVISKKLLFDEAKRRGKLSDEADYDKDQEQIATEAANNVLTPEKMVDPITGLPIVVTPEHGVPNPPPKPPIKVRPGEKLVMQ